MAHVCRNRIKCNVSRTVCFILSNDVQFLMKLQKGTVYNINLKLIDNVAGSSDH